MYASDAVIKFLPATETIAVANEIVNRLGRLNEDVSATDVFATYDAMKREQFTASVQAALNQGNHTSAQRCNNQVQHIIDSIAADSFTTVTLSGCRKPAYWLHRNKFDNRVIVSDRKGIRMQASVDGENGAAGRDYVSSLLGKKLAEGARVDQGVSF
jgi:hypothetical protein